MNKNQADNHKGPHHTLSNTNHPASLALGEFEGGEPVPSEDDEMNELVTNEKLLPHAPKNESLRDKLFNEILSKSSNQ